MVTILLIVNTIALLLNIEAVRRYIFKFLKSKITEENDALLTKVAKQDTELIALREERDTQNEVIGELQFALDKKSATTPKPKAKTPRKQTTPRKKTAGRRRSN